MRFNRKLFGLLVVIVVTAGAFVAAALTKTDAIEASAAQAAAESTIEVIKFDVAEDSSRFVFDQNKVFEDGMPTYGSSFITQGYIYEYGTLEGGNGILADGSPEFPDKVIGEWTCRGWFVGDGMRTETGPIVITTQLYDLGDEAGQHTLVSEGYELVDMNVVVQRAITGGTGDYVSAGGQVSQQLLGMNAAEGVNLRFELEVEKSASAAQAQIYQ